MAAAVLIILTAIGPQGLHAVAMRAAGGWTPHAPRWDLLAQAPLGVRLHVATVIPSFLIGAVLMLGRKGRRMHRALGWSFVVLMTITAVSALFIPNPGGVRFSVLYLFSLTTLVSLPMGVAAARRHDVVRHSRSMIGLYAGGLLFAGLLAFIPGRLMWSMVFG